MLIATMLLMAGIQSGEAADLIGTVTAPTNGTPSAATTITFTFSANLSSGDQVKIGIPATFGSFSTLVAADVTLSASTATFNATETFDTTAQTITSAVTGSSGGAETITVTIGATHQLTLPSTYGQTAIFFSTNNSGGTVTNSGYALVPHDNTVSISAHVAEALILSIDDTTINLSVDPSINDGRDFSQKNTLAVSTNAADGYVIQARLQDVFGASGTGNARLANGSNYITSGDAVSTENRLGYIAYNSDASKSQAQLLAENDTEYFSNLDSNLKIADGVSNVAGTITNSTVHTVYYGLNVDYTVAAGDYSGTITYTALPSF